MFIPLKMVLIGIDPYPNEKPLLFEGKNGHVTDELVSLPCIWGVGISGVHSCGTQERWAEEYID